jgi:hypothetical protein
MSLLQTVQADGAITRLLNLCQRDIRRSVKARCGLMKRTGST